MSEWTADRRTSRDDTHILRAPLETRKSRSLPSAAGDSMSIDPEPAPGKQSEAHGRIRIMLLDDHALLRDSLCALLESDPGFLVVAQAGTIEAALTAAEATEPDVAIVDIRLGARTGIDFIRELKASNSPTRVLILTAHADQEYVTAALEAGALGYVLKDNGYRELANGVREVFVGHLYVTVHQVPKVKILPEFDISNREREVLKCIAEGQSNKQIGRILQISVKTVEKHRNNLTQKLNLHGVAAMTLFAIRHGLVLCDRALANRVVTSP